MPMSAGRRISIQKLHQNQLLYLQTVCGGRYDVLAQKADEASAHCRELLDQMNAAQKRLTEIDVLRRHIAQLCPHAGCFPTVQSLWLLKKFLKEHQQEIDRHRAAKRAFNELGLQKLPSKKSLDMEYSQLLAKKKKTLTRRTVTRGNRRAKCSRTGKICVHILPCRRLPPRAKRLEQDER